MPKIKQKERFNRSALDCLTLPHGGEIGRCKYFCARCVLLCLELADDTTLMHALHEFLARETFKGAVWAQKRAKQISDELSKRRKTSKNKLLKNYEVICRGQIQSAATADSPISNPPPVTKLGTASREATGHRTRDAGRESGMNSKDGGFGILSRKEAHE